MAKVTATFPGATFTDVVTGYAVSACFTPGAGFQGNFYVYVLIRANANTPEAKLKTDLLDTGDAKRGQLTLTKGPGVNHTFPDIDFMAAETGATQLERFRYLTFGYSENVTDPVENRKVPTFTHTWDRKLAKRRLLDSYQYHLGDAKEYLLGFDARRSAAGGTILRFSSLANNTNCWWKFLLNFHKENAEKPQNVVTDGLGTIAVTKETVERVYVCEQYGDCLTYSLPTLAAVAEADAIEGGKLAQFPFPGYSPLGLLEHAGTKEQTAAPPASGDIAQTATFVFNGNHYRNISVP